jgi:hypothetical protein
MPSKFSSASTYKAAVDGMKFPGDIFFKILTVLLAVEPIWVVNNVPLLLRTSNPKPGTLIPMPTFPELSLLGLTQN